MEGKLKTFVWMKRKWARVYIGLWRRWKGESFMGKEGEIKEKCGEYYFGKERGDVWARESDES